MVYQPCFKQIESSSNGLNYSLYTTIVYTFIMLITNYILENSQNI